MKHIYVLFFFLICQFSKAQNSVMATGDWIKVSVTKNGIYKIDKAFLDQNNIKTSNIDPQKISMYMGQAGVLPQKNSSQRVFDLIECPVYCNDIDHKFDNADLIVFYAPGPNELKIDSLNLYEEIHPYSKLNYVFVKLNGSNSKRIDTLVTLPASNDSVNSSLQSYVHIEKELKNVLNSGRKWFGDYFQDYYSQSFSLPNIMPNSKLYFLGQILGIGQQDQTLEINYNGSLISKVLLPKSYYNSADNYQRYNRFSNITTLKQTLNGNSNLTFDFKLGTVGSVNAGAYLDFLNINYFRDFKYVTNTQIEYFNINKKRVNNFKINNLNTNTQLWYIQNNQPKKIKIENANGEFAIQNSDTLQHFVAFDFASTINPAFVKILKNQDIKSQAVPQLLVIYPEIFKTEIQRLLNHKREYLNVLGLSLEDIYNEFSGGKPDVSAIRDVCRYFWLQDSSQFKSLLLVGDASFDFKNNLNIDYVDFKTLVPTYESRESLEPIYSYCSDDYFGFLETHEGEWPEGSSVDNYWQSNTENDHTVDIGIGRLPVKSELELKEIITKIINYENQQDIWKNKLVFVADNRDFNLHQNAAEDLSQIALKKYDGYDISKIYLDDYKIDTLNKNLVSPSATNTLNAAVQNGSYLINYNGHGSEEGWAQEKLLGLVDIQNWRNTQYPLFFTATCQFGKFDNNAITSGAELALLKSDGGAIGLFTTTRPVYSSSNEKINSAFYSNLNSSKTLGELMVKTKNQSIDAEFNRNFSFLGDPTLAVPNFSNEIVINSIDGTNKTFLTAQKALNILGQSNKIKNGTVKITVFASTKTKKTLGSFSDGPAFTYKKLDNTLSQQYAQINNGVFSSTLFLPYSDNENDVKIELKGISTDSSLLSFGILNHLTLVKNTAAEIDTQAPTVSNIVIKNQYLSFQVFDKSSIYTGTTDSTKLLKFYIDDVPMSLKITPQSNYQQINISNYIGNLSDAKHTFRLIMFDNYNNKTDTTFNLKFEKTPIKIIETFNYPNPFIGITYFSVKHNLIGENLIGNLLIYDLNGRKIAEFEKHCENCPSNFEFGLDFVQNKLQSSEFIYKFSLKTESSPQTSNTSGKMFFWK